MHSLSRIPHLDIIERVLWTSIQVTAGVLTDQLTSGHISWRAVAYAFAYAVLKNVAAKKATGSPAAPPTPTPTGSASTHP